MSATAGGAEVGSGPAVDAADASPRRPLRGFWGLFNLSFGSFGMQVAFALQGANVSRIFQSLGAKVEQLPVLWIAAPLTGLLLQPLIGHYSDRTRTRLGRRRPYFLVGAAVSAVAMVAMPHARLLWVAAGLLWLLDGAINVCLEPFRAFVGEILDRGQRTAGFAFQTVFIGLGAVAASLTPAAIHRWLHAANASAPGAGAPASVALAFYVGAAALLFTVLWTVVTTPEFPAERPPHDAGAMARAMVAPRRGPWWLAGGAVLAAATRAFAWEPSMYVLAACLAGFGAARMWTAGRVRRGRPPLAIGHVLADLDAMSPTMRKLALVQFCSWFGLFILWIYATPAVAARAFGATRPDDPAYAAGADWVGVMFAVYNGVAALAAFALPPLARRLGVARTHQVMLGAGALGFLGLFVISDRYGLLLPMVGIGMAWAAVLTLPYAIVCESCPPERLGSYMGLFNIFITLPQLAVSTVMGLVSTTLFPGRPQGAMLCAALALGLAALAAQRLVPMPSKQPRT